MSDAVYFQAVHPARTGLPVAEDAAGLATKPVYDAAFSHGSKRLPIR